MSHRRRTWLRGTLIAAGLAWLGLATVVPAGATTLRKMDLAELVGTADRVVNARAVSNTVYWDPTGTQIFTDTTFEVIAEAKGQGPSTMTVTLLGGRIDPVEMLEEGTPAFSAGEEVVLFTVERLDGKNDLVGFTQGVMRVLTDAAGEKIAVGQVPLGVTLVQVGGPQPAVVRPSPMAAPLGTFMDDIRHIVDGSRPSVPTISMSPETDPVEPGSEIP